MSQPVYFSAMAELLLALGDQNPELGTFRRDIVPTLLVGDGSHLAPSLLPSTSYCGGAATGVIAATRAANQVTAQNPGGLRLAHMVTPSALGVFFWRVTDTPLTLAGAAAMTHFDVVGAPRFLAEIGTLDEATFIPPAQVPQRLVNTSVDAYQGGMMPASPAFPIIVPNGFTYECIHATNASTIHSVYGITELQPRSRL